MNGTHRLNSLTSWFLLREAETRARRFGDIARREFAAQLALAKQKLDSAQVLWAHQQYAEALRLTQETVTETLRAAELAVGVLPSAVPDDASDQPVWAQVLLELGSPAHEIHDAHLCQNGLPGTPPILNAQITARERGYFQKSVQVAYRAVDRLRPATRSPRDILFSRYGRVASLAATILVVLGLTLAAYRYAQADKHKQASLRERSSRDGYLFREDGSPAVYVVQGGTKYFIPNLPEFNALKYRMPDVEVVTPGSMGHLRDRPADGALLKERDNPTVYRYEGGQKRPFTSEAVFRKRGYNLKDVKIVPSGGLRDQPAGKPIE
jgi:hypothetical protein